MRIVICDAHQVFADALAALLRAADHCVIGSAHDLGEVTGILERDDADVCVTDLRCLPPERQRIEQAIDAFSGTAFVAVSTSADPASLRQALAAGFRGLSLKKDDFDEILRVLTTAAGEPAQSSESSASSASAASSARPEPTVLSASARAALRRGGLLGAGLAHFLTQREREALARLVRGESTQTIARGMGVRVSTARTHVDSVMTKLDTHSRLELIAYAVREGLVDPADAALAREAGDDDTGQVAHRR